MGLQLQTCHYGSDVIAKGRRPCGNPIVSQVRQDRFSSLAIAQNKNVIARSPQATRQSIPPQRPRQSHRHVSLRGAAATKHSHGITPLTDRLLHFVRNDCVMEGLPHCLQDGLPRPLRRPRNGQFAIDGFITSCRARSSPSSAAFWPVPRGRPVPASNVHW